MINTLYAQECVDINKYRNDATTLYQKGLFDEAYNKLNNQVKIMQKTCNAEGDPKFIWMLSDLSLFASKTNNYEQCLEYIDVIENSLAKQDRPSKSQKAYLYNFNQCLKTVNNSKKWYAKDCETYPLSCKDIELLNKQSQKIDSLKLTTHFSNEQICKSIESVSRNYYETEAIFNVDLNNPLFSEVKLIEKFLDGYDAISIFKDTEDRYYLQIYTTYRSRFFYTETYNFNKKQIDSYLASENKKLYLSENKKWVVSKLNQNIQAHTLFKENDKMYLAKTNEKNNRLIISTITDDKEYEICDFEYIKDEQAFEQFGL